MALIGINKNPTGKDLAVFGLALATLGGVATMMAIFKFDAPEIGQIIAIVFGVILLVYAMISPVRRPIFLAWTYATTPIGWTIGTVLMMLIYYGVVTPIGCVMRWFGRDPLDKRVSRNMNSYWVERPEPPGPERYFKQF